MDAIAAVILAAGEGKRMNSAKPKVLCEVLWKPMLQWVIDSVNAAGIEELVVVCGHGADQVEAWLAPSVDTCLQREQLGTGHAVMQAADLLARSKADHVLILCGDAPFMDAETLTRASEDHRRDGRDVTVISAEVADPFGYGRIVRDPDGALQAIVEQRDADARTAAIREVNSGGYYFRKSALLDALRRLSNHNAQGEYYLTDGIEWIRRRGGRAGAYRTENADCVLGANDRRQLLQLNTLARERVLNHWMTAGVELISPDGVVIGPSVRIGRDTVLLPGTLLKGNTTIGSGCVLGPNTLVEDSVIGDGVKLNAVQCYQSRIADGVTAGPFVHIRPNCELHEQVRIGDFVELKNSTIGAGSKVPHLTYVGDADVGKSVNFGCGCVTVNYDGQMKSRTVVEDRAFIGCNTNLVAPVTVGEGAYTAPGSTITADVPPYSLAIARCHQENKDGWVAHNRPQSKQK